MLRIIIEDSEGLFPVISIRGCFFRDVKFNGVFRETITDCLINHAG